MILARVFLLVAVTATCARAQEREDVAFEVQEAMPNGAWHAFVLGDLPELGGGDLLQAVKLQSTDGFNWSVTVSLPVNRDYTYQFYRRVQTATLIGNPANGVPIGDPQSGSTSTVALEPDAKSVHYHSDLTPPHLFWRQDGGAWQETVMSELGPGRDASERRFVAAGLGSSRRAIEFYFTDEARVVRDPQSGAYATKLDEVLVQDGVLYSYVPAPAVSGVRRDYVIQVPPTIDSTILGETRQYRVMLPRGYDEHPDRRYPVLYMYDGLFLWDGFAGGANDYDTGAARMAQLVDAGTAGEMILVGLDTVLTATQCEFSSNRLRDCVSPEDSFNLGCGVITGRADQFGAFIRDELKPVIDATYRTRPDREHTFAQGYSLGGVFAMYMGWELTDTFGAIASQSGSFWLANFPARIGIEPKRDIRIYMDTGTVNKTSIYTTVIPLRDNLVGKSPPYVEEGDLRLRLGYGQSHNFPAGGQRLEELMSFLWPATAEDAQMFDGDVFCTSTQGSGGRRAEIRASGGASIAANSTRLHAFFTPPSSFGIFVYGQRPAQFPFGDGFLCIDPFTPGIHRLQPIQTADHAGLAGLTLDLAALPPSGAIGAGETWHFQYVYRDAGGAAGFNASDGVRLTFEP
ncbi:MAG: hypothetical protein GY711_30100 [bacterium]|nr:hypothetical protein [bacterium]